MIQLQRKLLIKFMKWSKGCSTDGKSVEILKERTYQQKKDKLLMSFD